MEENTALLNIQIFIEYLYICILYNIEIIYIMFYISYRIRPFGEE